MDDKSFLKINFQVNNFQSKVELSNKISTFEGYHSNWLEFPHA
ncbi:hypothetical protein GCM10007932_07250 [Vibrio penaeicida]|uniref:Uncharacterized protein n=1 Tax=Vibrio penaeicida TaxID=104609 RepID=A0AAV5NL40_9VIBR|nr:hypothetical protein GCM10007932_07250 [Vibrio penaeicida]